MRAGRGCTRPDLPRVAWSVTAADLYQRPSSGRISCGLYRGRLADPRLAGTTQLGVPVSADEPLEVAADGCPGGWYRTAYVDSVSRYTRHRTETGGRVANPFFDAAEWQTQEAVLYYESEQERWHAYRGSVDVQRWRAREKGGQRGARG